MIYFNELISIEVYNQNEYGFNVKLKNIETDSIVEDIYVEKGINGNRIIDIAKINNFVKKNKLNYKDLILAIRGECDAIIEKQRLAEISIDFKLIDNDKGKYNATIIKHGHEDISGIMVTYQKDKPIAINYPFINKDFPWNDVLIKDVNKKIHIELAENFEPAINNNKEQITINSEIYISFYAEEPENGTCLSEITAENEEPIKDIKINYFGNENIVIDLENATEEWTWKKVTKKQIRKLISEKFKEFIVDKNFQKHKSSKNEENKNELGRIRNAEENSIFKYYPNTVLRVKDTKEAGTGNWKQLILGMSKEEQPLFSDFEFDILSWIDRLRYMTKSMITDLYMASYISMGWRDVNTNKLSTVVRNLNKYNLISRNYFVSLGNDKETENSKCIAEIYTLGGNGARLLREIGRPARYNQFDNFQDGNVVKCYLSANQWLIFMLKNYKDIIKNDYMLNQIIYLMSSERSGARIYAGVNLKNKFIIAEPWRRVDPIINDNNNKEVIDKLLRFIKIFDNPDDIFTSDWSKVKYHTRPVICFVCEDDAHINELVPVVSSAIVDHPQQEIWFTTDLKTFNEDVEGSRFVKLLGETLKNVIL